MISEQELAAYKRTAEAHRKIYNYDLANAVDRLVAEVRGGWEREETWSEIAASRLERLDRFKIENAKLREVLQSLAGPTRLCDYPHSVRCRSHRCRAIAALAPPAAPEKLTAKKRLESGIVWMWCEGAGPTGLHDAPKPPAEKGGDDADL